MSTFCRAFAGAVVALSVACGSALPARAGNTHGALVNLGGPVLADFAIVPLFYGDWSGPVDQAVMKAQQAYLAGLANYLSGQSPPAGQRPTPWQYVGSMNVTLKAAVTASSAGTPPTQLCDPPAGIPCVPSSEIKIRDIIHANQSPNGSLPAYDAHTLIMVFLPSGITMSWPPGKGCSYHGSESTSAFYAVVQTKSCGPLFAVTAHELFEAVTDPVVGQGWVGGGEAVDKCSTSFNRSDIDTQIGNLVAQYAAATPPVAIPWNTSVKAAVPGMADDTQPDPNIPGNVLCSTTGYYTPPPPPPPCIASLKWSFCYVTCSVKNCEIFYPYPLFDPLWLLKHPCLACGYEVVLGEEDVKNWKVEVVNAEGAIVQHEVARADKNVILRLKPSEKDIKEGAVANYRLKLFAGSDVKIGVPTKMSARLQIAVESARATK